jgi:hypothetical protein
MKDHARGFVIGSIVLMLALPVLYVGSEGAWYLATGESHFAPGSSYRTVYALLDSASDRCQPMYECRQRLADGWIRLSCDPSREAHVRPNLLPSPYYVGSVHYFPPDSEFKLSREAAARMQYEAEREAAAVDAAEATSSSVKVGESADE